jgi:glucose/arabinose dehydrogenase
MSKNSPHANAPFSPDSITRIWAPRLLALSLAAILIIACHGDGDSDGDDDGGNNGFSLRLERILSSLSFAQPLLFLQHPDQDTIFYVVQQNGVIWRTNLAAGTRTEFVDLSDYYDLSGCGECGLLGMAFHPDFPANGYVYLSFNEGPDNDMTSYVARFRSADNGLTLAADGMTPSTLERTPVFDVDQPYTNHNGGHIAFDTSGFLYLGLGDGGSARDPDQNGQDIDTVLGAMLRMNADGSAAPGNIVAGQGGDARIYAYGLRNPWRWSFDSLTGDLWLGDVGQSAAEEVDIVVNGGNYGWRCREGLQATPGIGGCALTGGMAIDPVAVYNHGEGNSITGGYVYRGDDLGDDYQGVYFFGDFGSGRIWGLFPDGDDYERVSLLDSAYNISAFGEDRAGELYVVDYGGAIYRIIENND